MSHCTLILGGARSGKSRYAEQQAEQTGLEVVYIATATAGDTEMAARIHRHQADRPAHWQTVEEPLALGDALLANARHDRVLLVDCLTLWLSNLLGSGDDRRYERETTTLLNLLPTLPGQLIMVSNEVGQGIIPVGELNRRFVDEAGRLHQQIAAQADQVMLMVAGLPLQLKGKG